MPTKPASKAAPAATSSRSPFAQAASNYWRHSRRPLVSLAFVVPLLVLYEGGVLLLGPQAVRNGADVWLRQSLDTLGLTQYFLLPALTVGLLLAWHHVVRDRWQISAGVLYVMCAECAVLGLVLLAVARVEGLMVHSAFYSEPAGTMAAEPAAQMSVLAPRAALFGRMVGFVGAGVYEEMLFRLMLFPPVAFLAKGLGAAGSWRVAAAVILTSLLFSAAHYVGPHGDAFEVYSFSFRFTAGLFFALLFVYRGFGIAAGTHALYDIFVSLP